MSRVTISRKNINKPAPRWYRKFRSIFYFLFVGALFNETLQRFGFSVKDVTFISAWSISIIEAIGMLLANGEVYAKDEDLGGGGIKNPKP